MAKAAIFRRPNPGKGQGQSQAISERGWEYEHDETDEQIAAIEGLIDQVREESGAAQDNDGCDDNGLPLRGATFSWHPDEDGNIVIATAYAEAGDGVISHRGVTHEGVVWVNEVWNINPGGTVAPAA